LNILTSLSVTIIMGACEWDENGVVEISSDESREWMPVPLIAVLLVKLAVSDVLVSEFC